MFAKGELLNINRENDENSSGVLVNVNQAEKRISGRTEIWEGRFHSDIKFRRICFYFFIKVEHEIAKQERRITEFLTF
jgi:hypothetical protein